MGPFQEKHFIFFISLLNRSNLTGTNLLQILSFKSRPYVRKAFYPGKQNGNHRDKMMEEHAKIVPSQLNIFGYNTMLCRLSR